MLGDSDSLFVLQALEDRNVDVFRWIGDEFPKKHTSSFSVSDRSAAKSYFLFNKKSVEIDADVVWLRRPRWPKLPDIVDVRDKEIAIRENRAYIRSLFEAEWENAVWVNSLDARRRANSKLLQLKEAQALNIHIPETLISNNPSDIRNFINELGGEAIAKPMLGGDWSEDGKILFSFTAKIATPQLPNDEMIKACPCIYQRKIEKKFEVRVVFFGSYAIAVKLHSQSKAISELDWRIGDAKDLKPEEIQIPDNVKEKCILLMRKLGIVHGSFDFAVDSQGCWIFFEVNEAGQFLWMETHVPHLPVLDAMAQFLINPSIDFKYSPDQFTAKMIDISRRTEFREMVGIERELVSHNPIIDIF